MGKDNAATGERRIAFSTIDPDVAHAPARRSDSRQQTREARFFREQDETRPRTRARTSAGKVADLRAGQVPDDAPVVAGHGHDRVFGTYRLTLRSGAQASSGVVIAPAEECPKPGALHGFAHKHTTCRSFGQTAAAVISPHRGRTTGT